MQRHANISTLYSAPQIEVGLPINMPTKTTMINYYNCISEHFQCVLSAQIHFISKNIINFAGKKMSSFDSKESMWLCQTMPYIAFD